MQRLAVLVATLCLVCPLPSLAANANQAAARPASRAVTDARAIPPGEEDLLATVSQSAVDKILDSVEYPFVVFRHPDDDARRALAHDISSTLSDDAVTHLLEAAAAVRGRRSPGKRALPPTGKAVTDLDRAAWAEEDLARNVAAATGGVLDDARALLATSDDSDSAKQIKAEIEKFVNGGIQGMARARGLQFRAHLRSLTVALGRRPTVALGAREVDVAHLETLVSFGAELHWYHPVPKFDFPWNWPWRWDALASAGLNGVRFDAAASLAFATRFTRVEATATCKRLRLDYPIIREIPLEGFVDRHLKAHPIPAYDAAPLLVTIPLLEKSFRIEDSAVDVGDGRMTIRLKVTRAEDGVAGAVASAGR